MVSNNYVYSLTYYYYRDTADWGSRLWNSHLEIIVRLAQVIIIVA